MDLSTASICVNYPYNSAYFGHHTTPRDSQLPAMYICKQHKGSLLDMNPMGREVKVLRPQLYMHAQRRTALS